MPGPARLLLQVPVVGGHAGITILPLLSQATPAVNMEPAAARKLMERIQDAGTEVGSWEGGSCCMLWQ